MQFHFHANQCHFYKNGFALKLALKQRHKGTRKGPIITTKQNNNDKKLDFNTNWVFVQRDEPENTKTFDELHGVWKCRQILFRLIDICSQFKLELRINRGDKIVKVYAN